MAALPGRGVIAVAGEDRVSFLQGLVSNDVALAAPGRAVWAALLTPQGKWLADFFILSDGERLLLDCERAQFETLVSRLRRFRLRAKVTVEPLPAMHVYVAWGGPVEGPPGTIAAPDPRLADAGLRILTDSGLPATAFDSDWDRHRLALGLPDGSRDLEAEKTVLLEAGFDELSGVSWTKGCYMGQELTARTRYRGLVKRRLVPVTVEGTLPPVGTPILRDGVDVGTLRSGRDQEALAVLRLDALKGGAPGAGALTCGGASLIPHLPAWIRLPERAG